MDKIEKYRNLNEQVNKILRKEVSSDLTEELNFAAEELVEALEDPNRVTMLMRSGLVDSGRVARVRTALKDPEKAMKNVSVRSDLINMLMSLINIITSNPTAFAAVKKGAKASGEMADMAEGVGAYTLKKTKVKKNETDNGTQTITHYDIMLGGKKVGEISRDDYFGQVDGELHGKPIPQTAIGSDIQAWLHRFLKSKRGAKFGMQVQEELIGGQKKLDVNKNGKVDGEDLAALRAGKKAQVEEEEVPHMEPKGKRGMAAVKRLGRDYKTGGFEEIAKKAAEKYGSEEAGKRVAGAVFQNMVAARKGG